MNFLKGCSKAVILLLVLRCLLFRIQEVQTRELVKVRRINVPLALKADPPANFFSSEGTISGFARGRSEEVGWDRRGRFLSKLPRCFWVTDSWVFIHLFMGLIHLSRSPYVILAASELPALSHLMEGESEEGGQEAAVRPALGWVTGFPFPFLLRACHSLSQGPGEGGQDRKLSMVWERGTGLTNIWLSFECSFKWLNGLQSCPRLWQEVCGTVNVVLFVVGVAGLPGTGRGGGPVRKMSPCGCPAAGMIKWLLFIKTNKKSHHMHCKHNF